MPSHGDGDAFYGGIVGFTHSVSRHPLLSWKVSERPLVGIVINIPPILLRWDCKRANIYLILRKSLYTKGKRRGRCCSSTYLYIYLNTYLDTYLIDQATFMTSPSAGLEVGDELDVQLGVELGVWKQNIL
jgi:hypothetical protein